MSFAQCAVSVVAPVTVSVPKLQTVEPSYQPAKVYPVLTGSAGFMTSSPKPRAWSLGLIPPPSVSKLTV